MRARFEIELKDNKVMVYSQQCYENTMTFNLLQQITKSIVIPICDTYTLQEDGFYTLWHCKVPTLQWLKECNISELVKYSNVYIIKDNIVYKYLYKTDEFIEISGDYLINNIRNSNIVYDYKNFFSLFYLKECLLKFINESFSIKDCSRLSKIENEKIVFERNNILMFYNLLKYYIDCEKYYIAQEILDKLQNCYNYCTSTKKCGCNG